MKQAQAQCEEDVFGTGRFHDLGLTPRLADHLHGPMGYQAPTRVQQSAIPLLLSGKDVLVNARTGTGKTVVYLAPIVHSLQARETKITRADGTYALILVPTRELCIQVCEVAEKLVHRFHWLVPGHVMGGENRSKEKARLRKGIAILVATPGRVLDHLQNTAAFCFKNLQWVVFDEADRLLDMGFGRDMEIILKLLKTEKQQQKQQHVLLSATLNEDVHHLAQLSLKEPATVGLAERRDVDASEDDEDEDNDGQQIVEYNISENLTQSYLKVSSKVRLVALLALLKFKLQNSAGSYKAVIFFSTCDAVDFHQTLIRKFRFSLEGQASEDENHEQERFLDCEVFRLHGNVAQAERTETFHKFSQTTKGVLLCTDVASRGLDFKGLNFIIQYDPPGEAVDYVHRVGRTARLGNKGEAVLFLQPCESEYLKELQNHGVSLQELTARTILDNIYIPTKKRKREVFDIPEMHPGAVHMQQSLESLIASKNELRRLALDAFRSSVRAYTTHRGSLKRIFQVHKLHLGHVAKGFGLRDAPSLLGKSDTQKTVKNIASSQKRAYKKRRLNTAKMME